MGRTVDEADGVVEIALRHGGLVDCRPTGRDRSRWRRWRPGHDSECRVRHSPSAAARALAVSPRRHRRQVAFMVVYGAKMLRGMAIGMATSTIDACAFVEF